MVKYAYIVSHDQGFKNPMCILLVMLFGPLALTTSNT
jgi:hypothetical protein